MKQKAVVSAREIAIEAPLWVDCRGRAAGRGGGRVWDRASCLLPPLMFPIVSGWIGDGPAERASHHSRDPPAGPSQLVP